MKGRITDNTDPNKSKTATKNDLPVLRDSNKTLSSTRITHGTNTQHRRTEELTESNLKHRYYTSTTPLQRYWPIHTRLVLPLPGVSLMSARVLYAI